MALSRNSVQVRDLLYISTSVSQVEISTQMLVVCVIVKKHDFQMCSIIFDHANACANMHSLVKIHNI